jgi:broad specificity phosphatase PhoE
MPTRVWLLRHAESAEPAVFHGAESDVGLSERGHRQARALIAVLAAYRPTTIVSSGMRRAMDTAAPTAAACGLPLRIEPALHERRIGALSGTPFTTAEGLWPATLGRWVEGDTGYAPPGAESFDAMRERVLPVWGRLVEEHAGGRLVIVAHGLVCKVLLLSVLPGWSVADWVKLGPIRNLGVSELTATPAGWAAVRLNVVPAAVEAVG